MIENANVCEPCFSELPPTPEIAAEAEPELDTRPRVADRVHAPRRRSLVVGDHSHERNPPPTLPRRRH